MLADPLKLDVHPDPVVGGHRQIREGATTLVTRGLQLVLWGSKDGMQQVIDKGGEFRAVGLIHCPCFRTRVAPPATAGRTIPPMDHPAPEWHIDDRTDELRYRGIPLARIYAEPDGSVEVVTRVYSEGHTEKRRMATASGGRRYVEAWLRKWGDAAIREVNNRVESARIEADRRESLPQVEIKPDPRGPRRPRKHF